MKNLLLDRAHSFINELDQKKGEAWSNDDEELAKAMVEFVMRANSYYRWF